jgi:ABC-type sugar transport system ATPase subunit
MTETPGTPLLAVRDVHKRFPGVHALRGVSLDFHAGEVHAVCGENGAGKSTLMHLLGGVHRPDPPGTILLQGRPVVIADEREAQRLGIALVHQERSLFAPLSVAENVFAGRQPVRGGRIDRRRLYAEAAARMAELDVTVDPRTPVGELPPAVQQLVEVAKALSLSPRVLILDEPTAALGAAEAEALFRVVDRLRRKGLAILYISHRLQEIFQIAQRISILRDGTHQGTLAVDETSPDDLVRRMVGRDVPSGRPAAIAAGPRRLSVRGLSDRDGPGALLRDIHLDVHAGEIVALAGLAGAGRTELGLALFGARPRGAGQVLVDGLPVAPRSPHEAIAAGIAYLSEDRKELGLFLDMTLAENVAAAALGQFGAWWQDDRRRAEVAAGFRQRLGIAGSALDRPVRALSGGNQQKVALAKWLLVQPKVLIVDEPTRGVDIGAKAEMHALLEELARQGTAILLVSSDLPEVLAMGRRVLVMRQGRIAAELCGAEVTEERIMSAATGASAAARRTA